MRTGVAYMGHHNPKHIKTDMEDIRRLGCDDVLLAAQENDFVYMTGKLEFFPKLAKDFGIRPLAIFWGLLNLFGGGRSSQFLLEYPDAHQVSCSGAYNPMGCYNHAHALGYVKQMIDCIAELGFEGYFIDEPTLSECFCPACRALFEEIYSADLRRADEADIKDFRQRCVGRYIELLSGYIKQTYPKLETLCCLMPGDKDVWESAAGIKNLDNLGTDIYWVNEDVDVKEMTPLVRDMARICKAHDKKHHQWLQCWGVRKGREQRIKEQGEVLLAEKPGALYVWAYEGQSGTSESCDDPETAWEAACEILRKAKQQ